MGLRRTTEDSSESDCEQTALNAAASSAIASVEPMAQGRVDPLLEHEETVKGKSKVGSREAAKKQMLEMKCRLTWATGATVALMALFLACDSYTLIKPPCWSVGASRSDGSDDRPEASAQRQKASVASESDVGSPSLVPDATPQSQPQEMGIDGSSAMIQSSLAVCEDPERSGMLANFSCPANTTIRDPCWTLPNSSEAHKLEETIEADKMIADLERDSRKSTVVKTVLNLLKQARTNLRPSKLEYATYPNHPEFPDFDLSSMMKLLKGPPPLDYISSREKIIALIYRHVKFAVVGLNILQGVKVRAAKSMEEKYRAFFTTSRSLLGLLPNPFDVVPSARYTEQNWESDKEIARQYLAGVNPIMIEVVKDVNVLSTNIIQQFADSTYDLNALSESRRLFYVSYDDLAELTVNPHQAYPQVNNPQRTKEQSDQPRYFYAPIAVFFLDDEDELDILGIQLERHPGSKVYTRHNTNENMWLFVKAHLANADSQVHEWVSHLGRTHLTLEPHMIAIHNVLKGSNEHKEHPLYSFFRPLSKDTLFVNFAGRSTLAHFNANSFGDYASSVGVGQFMQLIHKMWSRYDFMMSGLEDELASRGFDESVEMPAYVYREDGMKLWRAYGRYTSDFVDEIYASDEEVASDERLQEWANETCDPKRANVPGFPKSFNDRKTLAKVLQILYWTATGLHAAVNNPQYEFYTVFGNKPLGLRAPLPPTEDISREYLFDNSLPPIDIAAQMLALCQFMTFPSRVCIDSLTPYYEKEPYGYKSYKRHLKELNQISDEIERRNKINRQRGKAEYPYLNPRNVAASADI